MKITERKPGKRDLIVRAGEVLNTPEESVEKFNVDVHLTDQDWERAAQNLKESHKYTNPINNILELQASLLRLNPIKFRQLMSQLPEDVRNWYMSFGENSSDGIEDGINTQALEVRRKVFLKTCAREVYPDHQPPFVLSSQDRKELIESFSGYSNELPRFRALGLSSVLLHFPEEESNLSKDPLLILDEAGWQVIMDWAKKMLDTKFSDNNDLRYLIGRLVAIRTVSPERFNQLTLGKTFWDQALRYLEEMYTNSWPITMRLSLAEELHILSAAEVHINSTGVLVVETGTKRNLRSARPLPVRDVS